MTENSHDPSDAGKDLQAGRRLIHSGFTRRRMLGGASLVLASLVMSSTRSVMAAAASPVTDVQTYQDGLARLAKNHRFALIDIRADWCAVCHRIDRDILSHASVQKLLEQVALLKVDVTAMDEGSRSLLSHLGADGPPTFFVVETASGAQYARTRSVGSFRKRDLIRRLQPFAHAS